MFVLFSAAFLFSCAQKYLKIDTQPSGSQLLIKNEVVGQTPMEINEDLIKKYSESGNLEILVRKDGYFEKGYLIKPMGLESVSIKLTELNSAEGQKIPINYSNKINQISRDLLVIQGLIFSKNLEQAQNKLTEFNKNNPEVAAGYSLQASIDLLNKKLGPALQNISKAKSIDKNDPHILKLYNQIIELNKTSQGTKNE